VSGLKPYPVYKPSGVGWLGNVPEGWGLKRLKFLASYNDDVLSEAMPDDYEIQYVDIGNVEHGEVKLQEPIAFSNAPSRARRKVRDGDVIVSTVRTYLRAMAVLHNPPENLIVSTGFAVIRASKVDQYFLAFALEADSFVEWVVSESKGISYPAINASELIALVIATPSPTEQTSIATFLDRETAHIDSLVEKKTRFIELLKEKRQALITDAVTGKFDVSTGKPYLKYKPSGVEWLGDVPEGWVLLALKRILQDRKKKNSPVKTDNILSLSIAQGVVPYAEKTGVGGNKPKEDLTAYNIAYPNDLVLNSMNVIVGAVGLCKYFGAISPVYYALFPRNENILIDYYAAIFDSPRFQESLSNLGNGIMVKKSEASGKLNTIRMKISMETLGLQILPVPPHKEQFSIATFLDRETARIDSLIEKTKQSIELLKESRSALITAAVTGKIDVRGCINGKE